MMKNKHILFIILLMSAASLFVSCEDSAAIDNDITVIKASFDDVNKTKVLFEEIDGGTGLDLCWQADDYLMVVGDEVSKFTISSFSGKTAEFTGKSVSGSSFDIILSRSDDCHNRSYSGQIQSGASSSDHLLYDACLKGITSYSDVRFTEEWAEQNGGELLENGCLMFHLKLPQQIQQLSSLSLVAPKQIFYKTNSPEGGMTDNIRLDFTNCILPQDKIVKAYMMTSMQEATVEAEMQLTLKVETEDGTYSKTFAPGSVTLSSGKRNVIKLNDKNWKYSGSDNVVNLRLMSYNVGCFQKYKNELGRYSYVEVAGLIDEYDASVVGLNETDNDNSRTGYQNQPKQLALELGSGWTYYFASAANAYYGNGIVASPSCKVVKEWPRLEISKGSGSEIRSMGAIEYTDFVFCVTHLDHMSLDARKAGAELITNWALEHYGTADKPVFLVGDFNCTPDEETISIMEKNWNRISAEENTYPCPRPTKCIDYIFALKNGVDYVVGDSGVILSSTAADVTKASDHYPVYVDVRFNLDAYKGALDNFDDNQVYTEAIATR